ncbi:hypothetical protein [Pollutimonas subterranea]|uniref:hypothetical protein n=1 Tax=Pollutimonas subterranea TaxID=2045210 RepID=UPI0018EA659E|nr:hypothetical protein [Pollutimonas subterranea]
MAAIAYVSVELAALKKQRNGSEGLAQVRTEAASAFEGEAACLNNGCEEKGVTKAKRPCCHVKNQKPILGVISCEAS